MTTTDRFHLVELPHGRTMLCASEAPLMRRACGCVPVDTSQRCKKAQALQGDIRQAPSDLARHHATMALVAHLNGEGI